MYILTDAGNCAVNMDHVQFVQIMKPYGERTYWSVETISSNGRGSQVLCKGPKDYCNQYFQSVIDQICRKG